MIVKNLSKKFNNRILFENISFIIETGILKISGPSGCGKSTFVDIILNVKKADEGQIIFGDRPTFSCVLQKKTLFFERSLFENLKMFNIDYNDNLLNTYLDEFNFRKYLNTKIRYLSGGERKKAEIIFCILKKANVYIFDEPFSSLDMNSKEKIKEIIQELGKDNLVILINHDEDIDIKENINLDLASSTITLNNGILDKENNKFIKTNKPQQFLYTRSKKNYLVSFILALVFILSFNFACSFFPRNNLKNEISECLKVSPFDNYITKLSQVEQIDELFFKQEIDYYIVLKNEIRSGYNNHNISENYLFVENAKVNIGEIISLKEINASYIKLDERVFTLKHENLDYLKKYNYQDYFLNDIKKETYKYVFLTERGFIDDVLLKGKDKVEIENVKTNFSSFQGIDLESFTLKSANNIHVIPNLTEDYYCAINNDIEEMSVYYFNNLIAQKNLKEIIKITDSCETKDKIIMNLNQYKDYLLHIIFDNRPNAMGFDDFGLIINKSQYDVISKYASFTILTPLRTYNEVNNFYIFLTLSIFVLIIYLIFLFVTLKAKKKWIKDTYSCYVRNGISKKHFYLDVFMDTLLFLIPLLVISLVSFFSFIDLANYINMTKNFIKPEGYYYYSQQPLNNYYDSITKPIAFNKFNCFYFISYIIFLVYVLFKFLVIKIAEKED